MRTVFSVLCLALAACVAASGLNVAVTGNGLAEISSALVGECAASLSALPRSLFVVSRPAAGRRHGLRPGSSDARRSPFAAPSRCIVRLSWCVAGARCAYAGPAFSQRALKCVEARAAPWLLVASACSARPSATPNSWFSSTMSCYVLARGWLACRRAMRVAAAAGCSVGQSTAHSLTVCSARQQGVLARGPAAHLHACQWYALGMTLPPQCQCPPRRRRRGCVLPSTSTPHRLPSPVSHPHPGVMCVHTCHI
jgi:hypothetical protein